MIVALPMGQLKMSGILAVLVLLLQATFVFAGTGLPDEERFEQLTSEHLELRQRYRRIVLSQELGVDAQPDPARELPLIDEAIAIRHDMVNIGAQRLALILELIRNCEGSDSEKHELLAGRLVVDVIPALEESFRLLEGQFRLKAHYLETMRDRSAGGQIRELVLTPKWYFKYVGASFEERVDRRAVELKTEGINEAFKVVHNWTKHVNIWLLFNQLNEKYANFAPKYCKTRLNR